jgi:CheY-like chemotaxis protein
MGGTIQVKSAPGKGSTFTFWVRLGSVETDGLCPTGGSGRGVDPELAGRRVLIVDDNATNRRILFHQTSEWGMLPELAEDSSTALMLLRVAARTALPFDLVILDYHMPGMDGFDFAAVIQADPDIRAVPRIMLTSYGERGHRQRARDVGITAYLAKPVRHTQLHRASLDALRAGAAPDAVVAAPSVDDRGGPMTARSCRGRVLIAEDNVVNQRVARRQVEKLGFQVDVVANGFEALEALARVRYDAVLMDCQMPEMDGYQATRDIRRAEAASFGGSLAPTLRVPIIAMTANALTGEHERCLAAGMDDYITKPVAVEHLARSLTRWVPS